MRLNLLIELPPPPPVELRPQISVEDRVRDALNCIDSGHESPVEWRMVSRLFSYLQEKAQRSRREQNILDMIQPVLAKYGYYESADQVAPGAA